MGLFDRRPIRPRRDGRFTLVLAPELRQLLAGLAPQLREALADPAAPGLRRLFPPAYSQAEEAERQEEYARLVGEDLVERHGAALEVLERTATAEELDAEQLDAWARALNGLRLALGTRLDVSEDDDPARLSDPEHQVYWVLGWLQESVIEALAGTH